MSEKAAQILEKRKAIPSPFQHPKKEHGIYIGSGTSTEPHLLLPSVFKEARSIASVIGDLVNSGNGVWARNFGSVHSSSPESLLKTPTGADGWGIGDFNNPKLAKLMDSEPAKDHGFLASVAKTLVKDALTEWLVLQADEAEHSGHQSKFAVSADMLYGVLLGEGLVRWRLLSQELGPSSTRIIINKDLIGINPNKASEISDPNSPVKALIDNFNRISTETSDPYYANTDAIIHGQQAINDEPASRSHPAYTMDVSVKDYLKWMRDRSSDQNIGEIELDNMKGWLESNLTDHSSPPQGTRFYIPEAADKHSVQVGLALYGDFLSNLQTSLKVEAERRAREPKNDRERWGF